MIVDSKHGHCAAVSQKGCLLQGNFKQSPQFSNILAVMIRIPHDDSDDYTDVELAPRTKMSSNFSIDNASGASILARFFAMVLVTISLIYSAARAPTVARSFGFYAINKSHNGSLDIGLLVSEIQNSDVSLGISASFIRTDFWYSRVFDFNWSMRYGLSKGRDLIGKNHTKLKPAQVLFRPGSRESSGFDVTDIPVQGVEWLQVRVGIEGNFSRIRGVRFTWTHFNPELDSYIRSTRMVLAAVIAYSLFRFFGSLQFDSEFFTQVYVIVIGLLGLIATNPVNFVFSTFSVGRIIEQILWALFLAAFRMFVVVELEVLRVRSTRPGTAVMVFFALFFSMYVTVDATAAYDRGSVNFSGPLVLRTEFIRGVFHILYAAVSFVWIVAAICASDGANSRRLAFFVFMALAVVAVNITNDIVFVYWNVWMRTIRPLLIRISAPVGFVGLIMLMLRTAQRVEYIGIDKQLGNELYVIEIDELSADTAGSEEEQETDDVD
jgi:hypothetical protein